MKQIAIIGVGKIGIRHLDAILNIAFQSHIYLVEKNPTNVKECQNYLSNFENNHVIEFQDSMPENKNFDLVIIATDSIPRYELSVEILEKNTVKNLLLEKIIFARIEEYDLFFNKLKYQDTNCIINHSRRLYYHFIEIKDFLKEEKSFSINIFGDRWGLASNCLHFIDLIHFIFDKKPAEIIFLDCKDFYESKRKGYLELDGIVQCNYDNNSTTHITSSIGNFDGILIQIKTENHTILVFEGENGFMKIDDQLICRSINYRLVADTTKEVAERLFKKQYVGLPKYEEIYEVHKMFLQSINDAFKEKSINNEFYIS